MSEGVHVVCPHCDAVNRFPVERLADGPKCGGCHQRLFEGKPVELTPERFVRHAGRGELPLLVDFWAPWCGPCLQMAPAYAQAAGRLEPYVRAVKVDTEAHPALGAQFNIRSIPTLVLLRQGREVARQSGAMGAADIVRWVVANLPGAT
jgi:thioredoxin 2